MNGALAGEQLHQERSDERSGLDRSGAPLLYLGGAEDPAASSAQALIATAGPFAVHWVSSVEALGSHVLFTPIELVLLHGDVPASVAVEALAAIGLGSPVVRIGSPQPGDVDAGFASVPGGIGLVEAVRYELVVDELDRRRHRGGGVVPAHEGEGLFEWDLRSDHVAYSDRWEAICGPSPPNADSSPDRWFGSVDSADLPGLLEAIESHLVGDTPVLEAVYRAAGDGGTRRVRAAAVRDDTGEAIRLSGFVALVDEQVAATDDRYDALTGLIDRASFLSRLERSVGPYGASTAAVLVVGIDRFSWVNDSYGHTVGDQLLAAMGRRLLETVRPDDVVARLGGDEFAVLLMGLREPHSAGAAAERVLASTLRRLPLGDIELDVSVSIGVAGAAGPWAGGGDVLRQAEVARQRAKSLGGSTAVVFDDELEERASARLALEQELRRSIEGSDLVVHYQPIVDIQSTRVVALEALVRWNHPDRGLVPPGDFLPLAEESGLVVPLGEYVLEEACRQLRKWRNEGVVDEVTVSVNVSARQFTQSDLVDVVARSLAQTGLPPELLVLEITESTFIDNIEAAATALQEIRRLGVGIHTDDFGTGHAALSYLRTFPVDALKIDRSFVRGLGSDADSLAFVRAIVGLGHSLGLGVIAEGVETPEQLEILRSLGCQKAQGFLFSRPCPPEQLVELGVLPTR